MPSPWKHPKTSVYYFRKVVPAALREILGQTEFRISLGTKDLKEAKRLYPDAARQIDGKLAAAERMLALDGGPPIMLTHKDAVALAGEWYRTESARHEAEPGDAIAWSVKRDELIIDGKQGDWGDIAAAGWRNKIAPEVDELLLAKGLRIDAASRERLEEQLGQRKIQLCKIMMARADGNYTADPVVSELPKWQPTAQKNGETLPFSKLIEGWKLERNPEPRTVDDFTRQLNRLADHLGHSDALRVTEDDAVSWKENLLSSGRSLKSTRNHLHAAKAVFGWGKENRKVTINPFLGVRVSRRVKAADQRRRKSYSDDEARLILRAARREQGAKRWVPFLLAYSGARLDEMCGISKSDVVQVDGVWCVDLKPGRKLKNVHSIRKIPLHRAVIAEGFLKFVKSRPDGALFTDLTPDRYGRRGGNGTKIISRWVRSLGIENPDIAPNHSWRHRIKDLFRRHGVAWDVGEAVCGRVRGGEGDNYGSEGYPVSVLAEAIEKLPEIDLSARKTAA